MMRGRSTALLGALFFQRALAHNVMGILLVNQTAAPEWLYVRDVGPTDEVHPGWSQAHKTIPMMDIHHPEITCGREAFDFAANTSTADVLAGSEVGFRVSWDANGPGGVFYHRGPAQIYLSRAPNDDLEHFRGDEGDWFKIAIAGAENNHKWLIPGKSDVSESRDDHPLFMRVTDDTSSNFTIPLTTPPGKYLMRIEQWWPTSSYNYSQWFVNCAHVNIIGEGGGVPTEFAKFPGTYDIEHPGILVSNEHFTGNGIVKDEDMKLFDFPYPGPVVWTG